MLKISLLTGELIFALIWLVFRVITWIAHRRINWKREAALLLMYINLAVIIRFVFYPFFAVDGHVQPLIVQRESIIPPRLNLIPFAHIAEYDLKREALINIIGNVCLFIPTGIILPVLYRKLDSFWKVLLTGAGISFCIEMIQLLLPNSVSDIDDLLLNMTGVMIGYGIFLMIRKTKREV